MSQLASNLPIEIDNSPVQKFQIPVLDNTNSENVIDATDRFPQKPIEQTQESIKWILNITKEYRTTSNVNGQNVIKAEQLVDVNAPMNLAEAQNKYNLWETYEYTKASWKNAWEVEKITLEEFSWDFAQFRNSKNNVVRFKRANLENKVRKTDLHVFSEQIDISKPYRSAETIISDNFIDTLQFQEAFSWLLSVSEIEHKIFAKKPDFYQNKFQKQISLLTGSNQEVISFLSTPNITKIRKLDDFLEKILRVADKKLQLKAFDSFRNYYLNFLNVRIQSIQSLQGKNLKKNMQAKKIDLHIQNWKNLSIKQLTLLCENYNKLDPSQKQSISDHMKSDIHFYLKNTKNSKITSILKSYLNIGCFNNQQILALIKFSAYSSKK